VRDYLPSIYHIKRQKLANWLEHYTEALELPVWTSSEVTAASRHDDGRWHVTVRDGEQKEKIFIVKHLVFATGFGSYRGNLPTYPGMASSPNVMLRF
jgi:cation diffusion facilitator CzcD-associated flavoprotein CzcO